MRKIWSGIITAVFFSFTVQAQEVLPSEISSAYAASLAAMQSSKTPQDINRMIEAMDSPDWVSVAPTGEKTSRDQAEKQLLGLLSIPVGQRPTPLQKIIYVSEPGPRVLVVYWVYRNTDEGPVGSMVRDTWMQNRDGWRRTLHEKLFPDRPLKLP
ncbi:MAG: hypothetical protein ACLQGT_15440 [Terracidiphilus sp.]